MAFQLGLFVLIRRGLQQSRRTGHMIGESGKIQVHDGFACNARSAVSEQHDAVLQCEAARWFRRAAIRT